MRKPDGIGTGIESTRGFFPGLVKMMAAPSSQHPFQTNIRPLRTQMKSFTRPQRSKRQGQRPAEIVQGGWAYLVFCRAEPLQLQLVAVLQRRQLLLVPVHRLLQLLLQLLPRTTRDLGEFTIPLPPANSLLRGRTITRNQRPWGAALEINGCPSIGT